LAFSSRKTIIALIAVIGSCILTQCFAFISFFIGSSPYELQFTIPMSLYGAIISFFVSISILVGLPWAIKDRPRDYMPFFVGLGALLGACLGFAAYLFRGYKLELALVNHSSTMISAILITHSYWLWIGGFAIVGGVLAGAYEIPTPKAPIRWLIVFGFPFIIGIIGVYYFGD
jgi:hypothetical protein